MTKKRVPLVSPSWDEGKFWDRWMIVHFMSGVSGGFAGALLALSTVTLWTLAVILLVAWEGAEYAWGVREEAENRAIDVAIGLVGVLTATLIATHLSRPALRIAFIACTVVLAVGCVLGWRAFLKRTKTQNTKR